MACGHTTIHKSYGGRRVIYGLSLGLAWVVTVPFSGPTSTLLAQAADEPRRLPPATARPNAEFSGIVSVTELSDGRVLVADRREGRLVILDLEDSRLSEVGRRGPGPNEYLNVSPVFPLGGDSLFMADRTARRWYVIHPFTGAISLVSGHSPAFAPTSGVATGADSTGNLLSRLPTTFEGGSNKTRPDSVVVARVGLATGRVDTVGYLLPRPATILAEGDVGGRPQRIQMFFRILDPGEAAVLLPDGWVAIARLNPYRVDWRSPDGRTMRGAPLPFTETVVDHREKEAYRSRLQATGGRPRGYPPDHVAWARVVPPFENAALQAAPGGGLLIERTPTAADTLTRYDLVDRAGRLVMRIGLPANQRIVGAGAGAVFVAVKDELGIERIQRHPWFRR